MSKEFVTLTREQVVLKYNKLVQQNKIMREALERASAWTLDQNSMELQGIIDEALDKVKE